MRPQFLRGGAVEDVKIDLGTAGADAKVGGRVMGLTDTGLLFYAFTNCDQDTLPGSLVEYDFASGAVTTILPAVQMPEDGSVVKMQWNKPGLIGVVVGE